MNGKRTYEEANYYCSSIGDLKEINLPVNPSVQVYQNGYLFELVQSFEACIVFLYWEETCFQLDLLLMVHLGL